MDPQSSSKQPVLQKLNLSSSPILINRELIYALLFFSLLIISASFVFSGRIVGPFKAKPFIGIDFLSRILPIKGRNSRSGVCDYSNGRWVRDETYPLRLYDESCPFLDPGFRCRLNGRRDFEYRKWRWQPDGCDLPRFNSTDLLDRIRNGRIIFAGDSIGRNQWESLLCMLAQGLSNQSTIYEENGNPITKHKGYLSIRFHDYNLTVEYYRSPFLVVTGRPPEKSAELVRGAIRVDQLHWYSKQWAGGDVLVFNAGHWWNEDKTTKMGYYFQEGESMNMNMNITEAFQRCLQTWKTWALQNLDPQKSHIFFRSYSPVHYRDGTWNEGGHCHTSKAPETDHAKLETEPINNVFIHRVIEQMHSDQQKREAEFLNITYLTEFRKDGHPSEHREVGTPVPSPQDCSHWCLPGVPDTWNELLYARLVAKGFRTRL